MVKLIAHTIAAILTLLLAGRVAGWEKRRDAHGKTIIAYYASWQWYDRSGLAKPSNLDHSLVTRYTFAFFQINEQGDIWGTDAWGDPNTLFGEYDWNWVPGGANTYCSWDGPGEPPTCAGHKYHTGLISQAHSAGVEIYPSIGGWTLSDPFSKLAENPAARTKFAENCVKLIEDYDFDGIDIDWEYPGYAPHSGRDVDTVNYSLFLKEIRDKLDEHGSKTGRFYGLTAALPCGPDLIKNIQIDVVKDIMTEFNLMTYDFHGSWNPTTGVNAPLHDQTGSPDFSVHGCVKNWLAGGARPDQINIGLPFYGRSFAGTGLTGIGDTHIGKADVATWSDDEGSPQYFNIVAKINQFTSVRDEQTMTQFAYNHAGWVSYDDERAICDKCEYALDHSLNGYIIWEISGDLMPDLSQPLLQACNDRINDPGSRCDPTMEGDPWYAHPEMQGVCVNDGNQAAHYISKENEYTSAKACCDAHYGTYPECLGASTSPGSTGKWHETMEGDPWYPHSDGYCLSDGNHESFFITNLDKMFVSAEACCDAVYYYDSNCISNSNNPPIVDAWYAMGGKCKKGVVPTYVDIHYDNKDECCYAEFSGQHNRCVSSGVQDTALTPPPTRKPSSLPTSKPSKKPTPMQDVSSPTNGMYYPHYSSDDGSFAECRNDDRAPWWITSDMMKGSLVDCCTTYFFPSWSDMCISGNEPRPYYPDYTKRTCRNDGEHPDWQTGDYLTDSHYTCCSTHFGHDSDLLDICSGAVTFGEVPATTATTTDATTVSVATSKTTQATTVSTAKATAATTTSSNEHNSGGTAHVVEEILLDRKTAIDTKILLRQTPDQQWAESTVYRFDDMLAALRVMYQQGVAGKTFYMGDEGDIGHNYKYGLVNLAAFLAQSMKETIKYDACDENSWDLVGGRYPLSNACGQLGQSYQDYHCSEAEKHMECEVDPQMAIAATTHAKWWGAPAPLFCGPKSAYPHTGFWNYEAICADPWATPAKTCDVYDGQRAGEFDNSAPFANSGGRTEVEGCCWWGRGVIQTTGVCNFGKLNYFLGMRAKDDGRDARYPGIDFCKTPDAVCASSEHKELKWIAGMFYWIESLQSYSVGGWDYKDELHKFVDNGMAGNSFIDAVSGIVNRGCHNPPCAAGAVDGSYERAANFNKILTELGL